MRREVHFMDNDFKRITYREVLPGEEDIVKMLVEALELIGNGSLWLNDCKKLAKLNLAKYQAWKGEE